MKREFTKKLSLNKSTVANLKEADMKNVLGGYNTEDVCPTWFYTCDQETCVGHTC